MLDTLFILGILLGLFISGLIFFIINMIKKAKGANNIDSTNDTLLQNLLINSLRPELLQYFVSTSNVENSEDEQRVEILKRLIKITEKKNKNYNLIQMNEKLLNGSALLEVRVNNLSKEIKLLKKTSLTSSKVVYLVIIILGTLIAILVGLSEIFKNLNPPK